MAVIRQSRSRSSKLRPLEPYQKMWLEYRGEKLPKCKTMGEMQIRIPFDRLCMGKPPVRLDPHQGMPPWELYRLYGDHRIKPYGYEKWPKKHQKLSF